MVSLATNTGWKRASGIEAAPKSPKEARGRIHAISPSTPYQRPLMHRPSSISAKLSAPNSVTNYGVAARAPSRRRPWLIATAFLVIAFSWPLSQLVHFCMHSQLYSHILLIPFISGYVAWQIRHSAPAGNGLAVRAAALPFLVAVAVAASAIVASTSATPLARVDFISYATAVFVLLFVALCALFFGPACLRAFAFPLGFLIFMIPLPTWAIANIETALQYGSSAVAALLFRSVGTPLYHDDLVFQLPGVSLEIAPECSGIHSTLALLITSVVAGYLFLRSPWRRTVLAAAVIPLALLRNGFRVFTIGELCVHISPSMLDSPIHHRGGPVFFILSLIPFGAVLIWLVRCERPSLHRSAP